LSLVLVRLDMLREGLECFHDLVSISTLETGHSW
jgi:hypothetical protein